ncbi:hypothetical protein [Acinetobacter sp.]|uniref:hypothetical protein n=1 Tax=Acinetobacter sp. TaxID=472 RepID=UPI000C0BB02B|nr:hypothetical protein [Acinetobacter sp.]MAK30131.1 hypothetical protein [Acinetobacter sp.]QDP47213.1 MAG: hypothetical protein GOVbin655_47 [Prokaryotic dsDNA virus sp.]|tara:strand:- start:3544 stop:3753 length:210 start_codon:yes stop_codon:yes gene_type:complete
MKRQAKKKKVILADLSLHSQRRERSLKARIKGRTKLSKGHITSKERTKQLSNWRKEWFGWEGRKDGQDS